LVDHLGSFGLRFEDHLILRDQRTFNLVAILHVPDHWVGELRTALRVAGKRVVKVRPDEIVLWHVKVIQKLCL
jgi:hypothetical protein